jgi:hypothetical protein
MNYTIESETRRQSVASRSAARAGVWLGIRRLDSSKDGHGWGRREGVRMAVVDSVELGFSWCWESGVKTELGIAFGTANCLL